MDSVFIPTIVVAGWAGRGVGGGVHRVGDGGEGGLVAVRTTSWTQKQRQRTRGNVTPSTTGELKIVGCAAGLGAARFAQ